jgi:hypothetical protein
VVKLGSGLLVLFALIAVSIASAAPRTSYHSITVDGSCADWASDEIFATSDPPADIRVTWDANTIYIGWAGGDAADSDARAAAFDLDKGTNDGSDVNLGAVTFASNGQPDYGVTFAGSSPGTVIVYQRSGGTLNPSEADPPGTAGAFSATGCGGGPFAEVSLARSLFNGTPTTRPDGLARTAADVNGLAPTDDVGVYGFFQPVEDPPYGSMPASNMDSTPFRFEAYCAKTDNGRAPNQYCAATTHVVLSSFRVEGRTLTWGTGTEIGVAGFQLIRDGRGIAFVRAKGATRGASYRFVDRRVPAGTRHTYRLRVVRY